MIVMYVCEVTCVYHLYPLKITRVIHPRKKFGFTLSLLYITVREMSMTSLRIIKPVIGLEPTTVGLQNQCSTD